MDHGLPHNRVKDAGKANNSKNPCRAPVEQLQQDTDQRRNNEYTDVDEYQLDIDVSPAKRFFQVRYNMIPVSVLFSPVQSG